MRSGKKIAVFLVGCVALAGVSWLGLQELGRRAGLTDPVRQAEMALGVPTSALFAQADLRGFAGDGDPAATRRLPDMPAMLIEALDAPALLESPELARGAAYALVQVSETFGLTVVLLGSFDPSRLAAELDPHLPEQVTPTDRGPERVLSFVRPDPETCEPRSWELVLGPERVVLQSDEPVAPLLDRLGPPTRADRSSGWRAMLPEPAHPLLVVQLRPDLLPGFDHPLLHVLARSAPDILQTVALTLDRPNLLGSLGVVLEARLQTSDQADRWLAAWTQARAANAEPWAQQVPTLARWHQDLALSSSGSTVRGTGSGPAETVNELPKLLHEALTVAAGMDMPEAAPGESEVAVVEPWPVQFLKQQSLRNLRSYGSLKGRSEPVELHAGPFGIRVERALRSMDGGLDVEVRALGPKIANLREPDDSPRLHLERVLAEDGKSLNREASCGSARMGIPERLVSMLADERTSASKRIRLAPGTDLDDVAQIDGYVELDLPVLTARVVDQEPETGAVLREGPSQVELTAVGERSFAYRVQDGNTKLIAIRGLNESRLPLAARSAWDWKDSRSGEQFGARHYQSKLAHVEAIFATQVEHARYDFALPSARPGTAGTSEHVQSSLYIDYSPEQYAREFGELDGSRWPVPGNPFRVVGVGPFRLVVESLEPAASPDAPRTTEPPFGPRLRLLAPDIPNLTYYTAALELELRSEPEAGEPWRVQVRPGYRFGKSHLEADVELEPRPTPGLVYLLEGELRLRIPDQVRVLKLPDVEPGASASGGSLEVSLIELARDRFTLRVVGPVERLFSARAFSEQGEELAVAPGEVDLDGEASHDVAFRVAGQPVRIEIQVAERVTLMRYPVRIQIESREGETEH